jgi:ABC-type transport system involved in cytochrome c biogenesis permease subunit
MVSDAPPSETAVVGAADGRGLSARGAAEKLRTLVTMLASLKFTVTLFAMSLFIVLAGTMAQVDKGIWQVVDEYFRTGIAWIDFQLFFPPSFFPSKPVIPGGFYFPGGWLIGGLLAVNLAAAHGLRFRVQATGTRRLAGLAVIAVGLLITWLVILSGSSSDGLQQLAWISWPTLWLLFRVGLVALWLVNLWVIITLEPTRKTERAILITSAALLGGVLAWLLYAGNTAQLGDSSMRILWQLTKGTAAGLILLAGCVLLFKKRAGIVLLHGGVALMMFSELLVGLSAVEGQMMIREGEAVSFVRDIRELELAIVDRSDPDHDETTVVPESILRQSAEQNSIIQHVSLPYDIEVVKFMQNSALRSVKQDEKNSATEGTGRELFAEERKPVSGTASEIDLPAAYLKLTGKRDSKTLGTYLTSLRFGEGTMFEGGRQIPEKVTLDETVYDVSLRFKRTYKPYSLKLADVRKDDYIGTDTPMNYSSDVRVVDESRNVDRDIRIWMNNPLRYAGETFYQSSYHKDPITGVEATTLAVVTNSGWMIPYVACMIVATGLLAQFSIVLLRFLNRRVNVTMAEQWDNGAAKPGTERGTAQTTTPARREKETGNPSDSGPTETSFARRAAKAFPWVICVVLLAWVGSKARLPGVAEDQFDLYAFGRLPAVYQGRTKPIDTLARNSLMIISGKQTFVHADDERPPGTLGFLGREKRQPAIRWYLDLIAKPSKASQHKVIRIENPELLSFLGLEHRKGFRYASAEFEKKLPKLKEQVVKAVELGSADASQLSIFQRKVLELSRERLSLSGLLVTSCAPPIVRAEHAREDVMVAISEQFELKESSNPPPLMIPTDSEENPWETYAFAWIKDLVQTAVGKAENPAVASMGKMLDAYADGDAKTFNSEIGKYREAVAGLSSNSVDTKKINFEAFFNHAEPFYYSAVLYLFAFVLAAVGWIGWQRPLNKAAFWLIAVTFVLHTIALVGRIYISGRPPVTNLYSSAVFIGWGTVVLGMILERVYRIGIGSVIAATSGFSALLVAHFLAGDGDTFVVLQAVLDTQFWLATHVVCITLGYATTFVAGFLGLLYVIRGVFTRSLSPTVGRDLGRMIYGTLCFAIFFSFVGTVLGGLWADDSWGRFWGWDPKENGALIIVIWNALVLHARWGKMVGERGLAVLAIGGNIATGWSWFGVNELGVGLHSYGFTEGVLPALGLFVLSQLVLIGAGVMPRHWWRSRRSDASPVIADA